MNRRSYKFRIYPTKTQEEILRKTIGSCRFIYNHALATKSEAYKTDKTKISYVQMSAAMTQMRKNAETKWLNEISHVALQQSLRNLESAYANFFKNRSRYPKFKRKSKGGSARFVGTGFSLKNNCFKVNRIKTPINVIWSRELPSKPSSCTISLNPSGQWFASFVCEEEIEKLPKTDEKIGIDLGVETFATLSDGTKIKQPDSIRRSRRKLARSHRSLSRKKKGSNNLNKARVQLARNYQKVANIRNDFQQKLSTKIVHENQVIVIEDLSVKNMMQKGNRKLARLIGEQGWYSFHRMLEYKAKWYGRELVVIDRFAPTSQLCNSCGKTNKLSLDKRKFTCECGVTYDRDVNAAKNILAAGMAVSACGVDVRPVLNGRLTAKQEVSLEMAG